MVTPIDILLHVPLVAAGVWFSLGGWMRIRRLRNSPERAFESACWFIGLAAAFDWALGHVSDPAFALGLAKVRLAIPPLASLALFYFGRWLVRGRTLVDVAAVGPVLGSVLLGLTVCVTGVEITPTGARPFRDPLWYALINAQLVAYVGAFLVYLVLAVRRMPFESGATRRKLAGLLGTFGVGFVVWISLSLATFGPQGLALPASSYLILGVGVVILVFLTGLTAERVRLAIRRILVTRSRPFAAFWYHKSGMPLAQVVLPGHAEMEVGDIANVAKAVDHVMTTGFRSQPGALHQMRVGDYLLMFEEGRHLLLVVVLRGEAPEGLRSELRMAMRDFEGMDGRLDTWEGATTVAESALRTLDNILRPAGV